MIYRETGILAASYLGMHAGDASQLRAEFSQGRALMVPIDNDLHNES